MSPVQAALARPSWLALSLRIEKKLVRRQSGGAAGTILTIYGSEAGDFLDRACAGARSAIPLSQKHVALSAAGETQHGTQSEKREDTSKTLAAYSAKCMALTFWAGIGIRKQLYSFNAW